MSELAELLLLVVAALPPLAGAAAAIPGAWWPDARRSWFSTFACAACAVVAAIVALSPLWRETGLAATLSLGAWSADGSPADVVWRLSLDPTRAAFLVALIAASFRVSIALPTAEAPRGRQREAAATLLAAFSCASFSILATNLLLKAIALTAGTALLLLRPPPSEGGAGGGRVERSTSSAHVTRRNSCATFLLADALLYFVLLAAATTAGTLEVASSTAGGGLDAWLSERLDQ